MEGMPDEIETLWQQGIAWLEAEGASVKVISLPHTTYALPAYYIVAPAEASSNLARYDGVKYGLRVTGKDITDMYELTRAKGFGAEVRRRLMIGTYVLSAGYYDAYYVRAQKVRTLIKRDFELAFGDGVDAILTPATHDPKARKSAPGKDGRPVGPVPSPGRGLQLASARKSVPTRHVPRAVPPRRSHPVEVGRKSAGRRRR